MKFLILIAAVVALLWLLRGSRRSIKPPPAAGPAAPQDEVQAMVSCAQCGIHLPQNEALPGRGGVFCGEPHRTAFEKAHPVS